MSDWAEVAEKLSRILSDKMRDIRRDITTSILVDAAVEALLSVSPSPAMPGVEVNTPSGAVSLPVEGLAAAISEINGMHNAKIKDEMSKMGVVAVEDPEPSDADDGALVGEDGRLLLVRASGMVFSVDKDVALKVVSLGAMP